ncbi:hypothetical protein [Streptomyces sp. NPDC049879]|uniref:hypothetical protein n=1 Tax=Streptomyces sp. NPDC049879 TaxID=3365598 RepID=UPI00378E3F45
MEQGTSEEYEPPSATRIGTLTELAAGSYSDGESDDGDYWTTKYKPEGSGCVGSIR